VKFLQPDVTMKISPQFQRERLVSTLVRPLLQYEVRRSFKIHEKEELCMRKISPIFGLVFLLATGCATETRTVTSETRDYPSNTVVETKTETTESKNESGGVLSSTVDVVGDVIALPFRAVGALIRGIF
jgi:hypothetical protein